MKDKYMALYEYMANSRDPKNMKTFGRVMTRMMDWMIQNKPTEAEEFICQLESVKWNNYLTPKEADTIVAGMNPKAPWSREQWKQSMEQAGYELEKWSCYNKCSLFVAMNMIMSDSSETLTKYVGNGDVFKLVHDLAVDKLTDKDEKFKIREYFGV